MQDIGLIILLIIVVIISILVYFIPTFIAYSQSHPNKFVIFLVNLFFGMTGIVWVILLIIAIAKIDVLSIFKNKTD
jgi:hypothetical protein